MDRRAFEKLVHESHGEVFRSALLVTGNAADAADLVQDLYLDLLRERLSLEAARSQTAVLRWYVFRRSLMLRRSRDRRDERERNVSMSEPNSIDPEVAIMKAERSSRVWQEVLGLPDDLRVPIVLRFREEMTFAGIGDLLGVPVQTVHDRVERAQLRLRKRLEGLGLAAIPLPDLLLGIEGPSIPKGLEASLLSTGGGHLVGHLGGWVAALVLVVGSGLGLRAFISDDEGRPSFRSVDSGSAEVATFRRDPGASGDEEPRLTEALTASSVAAASRDGGSPDERAGLVVAGKQDEEATLVGRLVDQENRPVAGALVQLSSQEFVRKEPRYSQAQRSAFDGSFRFRARGDGEDGRPYRLRIRLENHEELRLQEVRLRAGETRDLGTLEMPMIGARTPAVLDLLVRSESGRELSGVRVELLPAPEDDRMPGPIGFTDEKGRLRVSAPVPGPGRLRIDGRELGHESRLIDVALSSTREQTLEVRLARGMRLEVLVRDLAGEAVHDIELVIADERDPDLWISAEIEADRYVFNGLSDAGHRLWNRSGPWSRFRMEEVRPGDLPLEVVVKRKSDPRDAGRHMAEIHLRLFSSTTSLPLDPFVTEFDLVKLEADEVETARADRAPWLLGGIPIQKRGRDISPEELEGEAGAYQIDGLEAGAYLLLIRHPDHAPRVEGPILLDEGEIRRDARLVLEQPRSLAGVVLDASGQPLPGAEVFIGGDGALSREKVERLRELQAANPMSQRRIQPMAVTTHRDGRFVLQNVDPGIELVLYALHPRFERAGRISWSIDADGSLSIRMGE